MHHVHTGADRSSFHSGITMADQDRAEIDFTTHGVRLTHTGTGADMPYDPQGRIRRRDGPERTTSNYCACRIYCSPLFEEEI